MTRIDAVQAVDGGRIGGARATQHTLRGLVAAGLGVAVLPAAQPAPPPGVVEIPLRPRAARRTGLIWASDRPMTPAVRAFRDFVSSGA